SGKPLWLPGGTCMGPISSRSRKGSNSVNPREGNARWTSIPSPSGVSSAGTILSTDLVFIKHWMQESRFGRSLPIELFFGVLERLGSLQSLGMVFAQNLTAKCNAFAQES